MHRHEIRPHPKRPLDLQLRERVRDAGEHVPAAQQRRAERHELRDAVGAIADELVQDAGDEGEGFGVVEAEAPREAALGEGANLGYEEFIDL
ncbi:hypothetical protein LTR01_009286, partial [Friedmanniomyces endolithicus]